MESKTRVAICTGTTCYVMGAAECIDELEERLADNRALRDGVAIVGATCLGYCRDVGSGGAPFVSVDDSVLERAGAPTVLDEIRRRCGDETE